MKPPVATEHQEQKAFFEWAALMTPKHYELGLMFAIPNGGQRHIITATKLKAEGVKAGVPDIFLPVARCNYHGLFIEMKKRKGARMALSQHGWYWNLLGQNYAVHICHGADEAIDVTKQYMGWA